MLGAAVRDSHGSKGSSGSEKPKQNRRSLSAIADELLHFEAEYLQSPSNASEPDEGEHQKPSQRLPPELPSDVFAIPLDAVVGV